MKKIIVGIMILAVIVAGIFLIKSNFTGNIVENSESVKEFTLDAVRFSYTPDTMTVNKGDLVRIKINNIKLCISY